MGNKMNHSSLSPLHKREGLDEMKNWVSELVLERGGGEIPRQQNFPRMPKLC